MSAEERKQKWLDSDDESEDELELKGGQSGRDKTTEGVGVVLPVSDTSAVRTHLRSDDIVHANISSSVNGGSDNSGRTDIQSVKEKVETSKSRGRNFCDDTSGTKKQSSISKTAASGKSATSAAMSVNTSTAVRSTDKSGSKKVLGGASEASQHTVSEKPADTAQMRSDMNAILGLRKGQQVGDMIKTAGPLTKKFGVEEVREKLFVPSKI